MRIPQILLTGFGLVSLLTAGVAQSGPPSVLVLNDVYHYGELGTQIPNPKSPTGLKRSLTAARGKVTFQSNLKFAASVTTRDIFAVRSNNKTSTDTDAGVYKVLQDSQIILDADPTKPGTDVVPMVVNADASIIIGARQDPDVESFVSILLRRSTGKSVASLKGQYFIVSTFMSFGTAGMESGAAKGIITMDGAGKWTFKGSEQGVASNGTSKVVNVSDNGTYTVASDGTFALGATEVGAISPDGEVFYFAALDTDEVGLTVAVKLGSKTAAQVAGDWAIAYHELNLGTQSTRPMAYTEQGRVDLTATATNAGTFAGSSIEVESDPTRVVRQTSKYSGAFATGSNGLLRLNPKSTTPADLTVASGNQLCIGTAFHGSTDLFLGLRICDGSGAFGTGTKGTGGVSPTHGMTTFPLPGNQAFALNLVDGVGGGTGFMAIALGSSTNGIPFLGGRLYVDPNLIGLLVSVALSGTKGAPGAGRLKVPMPIPNQSALRGVKLYFQSVINDAGNPSGVALTDGFVLQVCR